MNRKILSLCLLWLLILAGYVSVGQAHPSNPTDPTLLVIDTVHEPATLDPSYAYDMGSHEVIMNVYEPLLFFDRDYTLSPYAAGKIDQFATRISSASPTIEHFDPPITNTKSGLPVYSRFTFSIRTGIKFHHGQFADPDGAGPLMGSNGILRPRDVEYSFERALVQDRTAGPVWMLYEPLLGVYEAKSPSDDSLWGTKIDGSVEVVGNSVQFNLATPYPDVTFKQILSQPWSSIMSEAWAVSLGDLNMAEVTPIPPSTNPWSNWSYIFNKWHAPSVSKLQNADGNADPMKDGGTGPYRVSYWARGTAWSVGKFDDYWDSWPAWKSEARTERIGGYITTVIWHYRASWIERWWSFYAGTTDLSYVDRQYRDQVLGTDKIRTYYRYEAPEPPQSSPDYGHSSVDSSVSSFTYEFPMLALDAFFFNFNIAETSDYAGSMKPPGVFGEDGVPPNIFSDINVRRGFAYAFDYNWLLSALYLSEGEQPSDPIINGLPYDNPTQEKYSYNEDLAPYYLELAWGGVDSRSGVPGVPVYPENPAYVTPGALWNNGMKFYIVFPAGNSALAQAAELLSCTINNLHPDGKFHVNYAQAMMGLIFLPAMESGELPLFLTGWRGEYPDPNNFVHAFMHSKGYFGVSQHYNNPIADSLIEAAISTQNESARQQIYYDLQALYHNDVPSVPLVQPRGRQYERDWMRGWYYNPVYQGQFIYHLWKAKTHFGDVNWDGIVGGADWSGISSHWNNYAPQADINGGVGGIPGGGVGLVTGIPDGKVSISDLSLVSAYWDIPPGPSHP